jgi:hypothetical protein
MGFRKAIRAPRLVRSLMFGTAMLSLPPAAGACGYHDDVSLARGLLNWVYPDALHVVGAMAQAVSETRLPAPTSGRERDPWGYRLAMQLIDQYAQQLRMLSGGARPPAFSVLLIEPMLWTRFVSADGDLQTKIHTSGPEAGDLVLISGEDVIREIANSRLSIGEAYRHGLIRFYGTEGQVAFFLTLYEQVGRRHPTQRRVQPAPEQPSQCHEGHD